MIARIMTLQRQAPAAQASRFRLRDLPQRFETRWLAVFFLACALPTGLCLALLTPMGQVADEPAHIARAAGLLHGQILGQRIFVFQTAIKRSIPFSGMGVNDGLVSASFAELPDNQSAKPVTAGQARAASAIPWSKHRAFDSAPNTVQYFPALYLPGTLGITLTGAFGGSPLQALYGGRIAMLLAYLALGASAIAVAAFGRTLLFALLSLPMALGLAASFNQDGPLIAASALTGALLTLDPRHHPRLRFAALPLFSLVLCSKPPYGLLLFAALCPLASRGLFRRLDFALAFAVAPVLWVGVMLYFSAAPYYRLPYHPGPLWPGDPHLLLYGSNSGDNFRVLLAKPSRFLHLPIAFFQQTGWFLIRQGIGWLGWLSVKLAHWAYAGWIVALGCAAASVVLGTEHQAIRWRPLDALFILVLIVITAFAVTLAIYLSWDPVGQTYIIGPQGRYFLLLIPFLMLALPRAGGWLERRKGAARSAEALLALPAIAMTLIDLGYLPWLIVQRFYLH